MKKVIISIAIIFAAILSSHAQDLPVNGDINATGRLNLRTNSSGVGDLISLYAKRLGAINMYGFGIESTGGILYNKAAAGYNWYIGKNADNGISALMSLKSTGNLGIGTNTPDTPIEIYKVSTDSHTDFLKLTMNSWSKSKNKNKSIVWDGGGNIITAGIGASYNGTMVNMDFHSFYNAGEKTDSDVIMRIQGSGNVGIGYNRSAIQTCC